ncbi:MAG: nucleotidyltransferase domain-containing protein [Ardenticatenaceae bacterium]|nr:nucleotidyltransferase domain-containing protein [Ardenticatenaceae bacterium]
MTRLNLSQDEIKTFCHKWKIVRLDLFGSVIRDNFRSDSDVDVLVTFAPDAKWTLLDHVDMQDELKVILGRDVDLVSRHGIERSQNHIRRREILNSARMIYAAS